MSGYANRDVFSFSTEDSVITGPKDKLAFIAVLLSNLCFGRNGVPLVFLLVKLKRESETQAFNI